MADVADRGSSRAASQGIKTLPVRALGLGFNLLNGVRVLDLTSSVAGPYCAMLLGDMGADVIKIERPGTGDDARAWGPPFIDGESLWFVAINRNKRSVALNYTTPRGWAALAAIIKRCDVVVVNQPPRVLQKLSIDAASCQALRQDLIYVAITGFGLHGSRSDWTCYDLIAEGYSGVMDLTGEPDGDPQKIGAPAADMLAGADAAYAAVAALFDRQRTGRGHIVDVSLVESMTRFLSCRIVPFMGSAKCRGARAAKIASSPFTNPSTPPITRSPSASAAMPYGTVSGLCSADQIWGKIRTTPRIASGARTARQSSKKSAKFSDSGPGVTGSNYSPPPACRPDRSIAWTKLLPTSSFSVAVFSIISPSVIALSRKLELEFKSMAQLMSPARHHRC